MNPHPKHRIPALAPPYPPDHEFVTDVRIEGKTLTFTLHVYLFPETLDELERAGVDFTRGGEDDE